tara:strand:+ start:61 stop:1683 length:1623 start_codon:yes stop_codon:yes gene_type:complete
MKGAYRRGEDREQALLLPERVEDYITEDSIVRVIDVFVDEMSCGGEDSSLPPLREMTGAGGSQGYSPLTYAKLLIWGYVNRVRSTRRLETETKRNLELIWLLQKLTPDHSSISRFRKANRKRIKRWLKEFNLVCAQLGLIGGEELGVDGVFLKAVNSKANNHTQKRIKARLEKLSLQIEEYLTALETSEEQDVVAEGESKSGRPLSENLAELRAARERAQAMLEQAQQSPTGQYSEIDPDARLLKKKSAPGSSVVGYLAQSAVDSKEHLIVAAEVTTAGKDVGQLSPTLEAAEEVLPSPEGKDEEEADDKDQKQRRVLADGGYFSINDLADCEAKGWAPYVPTYPQRRSQSKAGLYATEQFIYDPETDSYHCPASKELERRGQYRAGEATYQTYYAIKACRECPMKERCTQASYRKIHRHESQATVERMRERQAKDPEAHRRRASLVEHPFGSMMYWNQGRDLLCRGKQSAQAEFTLSALAYNLKRAVKVVGVAKLIEAIKAGSQWHLIQRLTLGIAQATRKHIKAFSKMFSPQIFTETG